MPCLFPRNAIHGGKIKKPAIGLFPLVLLVGACGGGEAETADNPLTGNEDTLARLEQVRQDLETEDPSGGDTVSSAQDNERMARVQMVAPGVGGKDLFLFSQPVPLSDLELLQLTGELTIWMRENREEYGATAVNGSVSARGEEKLAERFDEKRSQLESEGHTVTIVEMPIDQLLDR